MSYFILSKIIIFLTFTNLTLSGAEQSAYLGNSNLLNSDHSADRLFAADSSLPRRNVENNWFENSNGVNPYVPYNEPSAGTGKKSCDPCSYQNSFNPLPNAMPSCEIYPYYKSTVWLVTLAIFLLVLLLLGIAKGVIGLLYCPCIGMYGLNMLIELPRPLSAYQEPCILHRTVVYDEGGWPVHPDTGDRTVKLLSNRMEFFLNVVFFIAYPLALTLKICEYICCVRNYSRSDENVCFKDVNIIKMMDGRIYSNRQAQRGPSVDIYRDGDGKEELDTQYVCDVLRASQSSLKESYCGFHHCH